MRVACTGRGVVGLIGTQGLANHLPGRFGRTILSTAPNGHPPLGAIFPEDLPVDPLCYWRAELFLQQKSGKDAH